MATESVSARQYPWTTDIGGSPVTMRIMTPDDIGRLLEFVRSLPPDDLLFLSIDLTRPEAAEQWARYVGTGRIKTILLERDGKLVGHGSLGHNELVWTRHLGEIQLLINPELRGQGLGSLLANEVFLLAKELGLKKIVARMASEQHGAIQVFERLGFRAEALLADYVIDREGRTHDLIVMSYDVTGFTLE
ncbi:MAG TPA: GNAT family protein [Blastocatellia bacterium]|nr:GNAT family protein [Blastocatellia bacterium]